MLRHIYSPVNETIKGLFPLCNLGAGMYFSWEPCLRVLEATVRVMISASHPTTNVPNEGGS